MTTQTLQIILGILAVFCVAAIIMRRKNKSKRS
jgi:hypothetical protein